MKKIFILLLLIPLFAIAGPKKANKQLEDSKCRECHSAILGGKTINQPATQQCAVWHKGNGQPHPQEGVTGFALSKEMPDLCYTCHAPKNTKKVVHSVVNNGKCMICHTPHSSNNAKLLKAEQAGSTCLECHDDLGFDEFTSKHTPVANLRCQDCHDPHQSDYDKLIRRDGQELCLGCHEEYRSDMEQKVVHAPFKNKCSICHQAHGSKNKPLLTQNVTELCWGCHDDLQYDFDKAKFKHRPVTDSGSCVTCHTPHASANDKLFLTANQGDICGKCHDLKVEGKKSIHGAVSQGKCSGCHDPHKSDNKNFEKGETLEYCTACHTKEKAQLEMPFVHSPFKNRCNLCHVPHASDESYLLTKKTQDLCIGCHDDFEEPMQTSAFVHQPMKDAKSCANCHSPHASGTEKILIGSQTDFCLNCHGKTIKSGTKTLTNFKKLFQKKPVLHSAITQKGCSSCHNPHFGSNAEFLSGIFVKGFYTPAMKDNYSLCFNCHNPELMTEATTTTATAFRNGNKNMHYLHIQGPKSRNCSVCHEIHASDNKHLLVDQTRFGNWDMKMNFTELDGGGSCQTGCHGDKPYKR